MAKVDVCPWATLGNRPSSVVVPMPRMLGTTMKSFAKYKTTRYLTFFRGESDSGKTAVMKIRGKSEWLGEIKWFSRWRQYAFFPYEGTIWNRECMADVMIVIDYLTQERRQQSTKGNGQSK